MCNQQPSLVKSLCKAFTPTATVSGLGHIILSLHSSCNSMDTPNKEPPFLCTSLVGPDWWQDIVQIPPNEIGFLPTIPIVSYYFSLCVTWSPWIHFLALPISAFIHIASLLGGTYIPTHPNPTHPQWTISKPVLFHEVFSGFPLSPSLPTPSLTVDLHLLWNLITFHF